jgi:hypothetical protein
MNISILLLKIISSIFFVCLTFFIGIATMIYGWGIHPVSWGWIIFSSVATWIIMVLMTLINAIPNKD